jgi:hypothetical protein
MFTTANEVKTITGKVVDSGLIERAQYVIESYIGKFENEVSDMKDLEILKRAVAYQSAYMLNNEDIVFEHYQKHLQYTKEDELLGYKVKYSVRELKAAEYYLYDLCEYYGNLN